MGELGKLIAVVRVRGGINVKQEVLDTLRMLGLTRVNHCVLLNETPAYSGMIKKVKDYVTWGEIKSEVLEKLLRKRGRLAGDVRLTDEHIKSNTKFSGIGEFARAVHSGEVEISSLPGLKKVFRLRPPKKGYESTKRPFKDFGSLGYRGEQINDLLLRMI